MKDRNQIIEELNTLKLQKKEYEYKFYMKGASLKIQIIEELKIINIKIKLLSWILKN